MSKEIQLFDPEKGFYKVEVSEDLEYFPHLLNEVSVLGLCVLQEEDDGTFALGIEQIGGAVSPWFDNLEKLQEFCPRPESRETMRAQKSRPTSNALEECPRPASCSEARAVARQLSSEERS